jgi:hypothetical protein
VPPPPAWKKRKGQADDGGGEAKTDDKTKDAFGVSDAVGLNRRRSRGEKKQGEDHGLS